MRYLILSDIHGNWEALAAAVKDARGAYDQVLCLGDLVGYCADPNRVSEWIRKEALAVVRGNHDKACSGTLEELEWFNPIARKAAQWTAEELTPANLEYLRNLPKGPICLDGFELVHGSPLDEDDYLVSANEAAQVAAYLRAPVSFFGHTHLQGGFACHRNGVTRIDALKKDETRRTLELDPYTLYLINPGSIGQPRDGDARAAYALYDPEGRWVEYRRTPYDLRTTQRKIVEAGLPELLACRLEVGT